MKSALEGALPLVEVLWRRERDAEQIDTPERQAGLEQRLMAAAAQIEDGAVRGAYERELKSRKNDHLWSIRSQKRSRSSASRAEPVLKGGSPAKVRGLGLIVRAIDNPHLCEAGYEALALADLPDEAVSNLRNAVLAQIDSGLTVDRSAISGHLSSLGKSRAAELLNTYPDVPEISPSGPEEREWLIALEQYARPDGIDPSVEQSGDAFASLDDAKRRHRLVSERQAKTARLNEAIEQADQD